MTACIVDHLELIEIEIQQGMRNMRARRAQQVGQAVLELGSIDQARKRVVGRLVGQLLCELALLRDISKNQDNADARVVAIADRSRRHVDIELPLVPADQQAAVARPDTLIALQTPAHGVFGRLARDLIDNMKYLGERAAPCRQVVPAGQTLSDRVEVGDAGRCIRGDDSIPDAGEGDTEQILFRSQNIVGLRELCRALLNFVFQVVVRATQLLVGLPALGDITRQTQEAGHALGLHDAGVDLDGRSLASGIDVVDL